MGRIKWNLDMLEEVRMQHDEAMTATEQVINKGRSDLSSMTEEVWEGEDGDMARDQLHDLLNKEMVETWKQLDACNEAIQKAQKTAYESKNFCNRFPQIFSGGSMPSDSDQGACSGDLLCDNGNCSSLKDSMSEAGQNAVNVKSKVESAESILAELETDEAKFDYSSYTQPIKEQTQKVAERTGVYNTAVSKYEQKTQEMDDTFSNELIAATPTVIPEPFDPSCLELGDEIHMKDGDIINFLEEYNSVEMGGKLSDAQLENILDMLFDKKDIDVSALSEKDFGMAFITLPEEQKKAVLMEMGYSREQVDSILESFKGKKAPVAGAAFARTLFDRISDKYGDKYHSDADKTGLGKALGLAGLRRPGEKDFGIAKTSADKADAAGGTKSNNNQKSKPKAPKNNSGNNTNNSGSSSTGNNTSPTADPYAEYKENVDAEVAARIDELFVEYDDDLGLLTATDAEWLSMDPVTKAALAAIYDACMKKIELNFDESDCEKERILASNILHTTTTYLETSEYVFDSQQIDDFESYLNQDSIGFALAERLKDARRNWDDNYASNSYVDISFNRAGISIGLKNQFDSTVDEVVFYTNDSRTREYIRLSNEEDPGCYAHTLSLLNEDQIVEFYCCSETSGDMELIDNLMKSDSSYDKVFSVDSDRISNAGALLLAQYGNNLLTLSKDYPMSSYGKYYNSFLSQIVTPYQEGDIDGSSPNVKNNGYCEKYAIGCSLLTDSYLALVWASDPAKLEKYVKQFGIYGSGEEIQKQIEECDKNLYKALELAKENEEIAYSLYCYAKQAVGNTIGVEVRYEESQYGNRELYITDINRNNNYLFNWEVYKQDEEQKIQIYSYPGASGASDDQKKMVLREELEKKRTEALKEAAIDIVIGIAGICCKPVGIGLTIFRAIIENDATNVVSEAADFADGKIPGSGYVKAGATLYSVLSNYQKNMELTDVTLKYLEENKTTSSFYTTHFYDPVWGKLDDDYYCKIDDFGVIRLIQKWSQDGIGALSDEYVNIMSNNKESIVENVTKELAGKNYTEEEINKVWNTVFEGYSTKDDSYSSILEIPSDLFLEFLQQINYYSKEYKKAHGEEKNYKPVQDNISIIKNDYEPV